LCEYYFEKHFCRRCKFPHPPPLKKSVERVREGRTASSGALWVRGSRDDRLLDLSKLEVPPDDFDFDVDFDLDKLIEYSKQQSKISDERRAAVVARWKKAIELVRGGGVKLTTQGNGYRLREDCVRPFCLMSLTSVDLAMMR
jgi:hypothetical protein